VHKTTRKKQLKFKNANYVFLSVIAVFIVLSLVFVGYSGTIGKGWFPMPIETDSVNDITPINEILPGLTVCHEIKTSGLSKWGICELKGTAYCKYFYGEDSICKSMGYMGCKCTNKDYKPPCSTVNAFGDATEELRELSILQCAKYGFCEEPEVNKCVPDWENGAETCKCGIPEDRCGSGFESPDPNTCDGLCDYLYDPNEPITSEYYCTICSGADGEPGTNDDICGCIMACKDIIINEGSDNTPDSINAKYCNKGDEYCNCPEHDPTKPGDCGAVWDGIKWQCGCVADAL